MDNSVQQDLESSGQVAADLINAPNQMPQHEPPPSQPPTIADTTRQSNTPVVSLLSLDQHQEKDFSSMQGGRRRKLNSTPPNNNNNNTAHNYNGYTTSAQYPPFYGNVLPPPNTNNMYGYTQNNFNGSFPYTSPGSGFKYQGNKGAPLNGQDRSWTRKRRVEKRNTIDTGSLSSLRTDSNSSASVADENRNEDKIRNEDKNLNMTTTDVDTPPPAPYSPMTSMTQGYLPNYTKIINPSSGVRHYQNRSIRGGGMGYQRTSYSYSNSSSRNLNKNNRSVPSLNNSEQRNSEPITSVLAHSNKPSVSQFSSQVHAGATPPQHFAPPMRRGRRSMRRSTQAINEIGAGDAPLPNSDVSDACKKLDSLKL